MTRISFQGSADLSEILRCRSKGELGHRQITSIRRRQDDLFLTWLLCLSSMAPLLAVSLLGAAPSSGQNLAGDSPFQDLFIEAAAETGLLFEHQNGAHGDWYFPEINGSGVALFDYDNDGDLDVYLVQSGPLKAAGDSPRPMDRLFRNDLGPEGKLRFVDVTERAGLRATAYGMAVLTADFDNDGWIDIYLGGFGRNQMWRSTGSKGGRVQFEDVTDTWQVDDRRWTAALTVLDFDRDGRLDLYLGNYLKFEPAANKVCATETGARDYCHPSSFSAVADLLFHNRQIDGQTRFIDVTRRAFGSITPEPVLGVVAFDADNDGLTDLYLAHDDRPNRFWRAAGDGSGSPIFQEEGLPAGAAVNAAGRAEASMGIGAGDFDNDGDTDLFLSHLNGQTNTLYVNEGGFFRDQTRRLGLGAPSLPFTGFGTQFFDPDLDGDLDLFVVNGAVQVLDELRRKQDPHPFHQPNQLFENRSSSSGKPRFIDASARGGEPFRQSEVSRGAAVGDLDNDGDPDLVVSQNGGPARVWLNQTLSPGAQNSPHWIGLRLVDPELRRDALGARAHLRRSNDPSASLYRRVAIDGSYASSNDPRLRFGLRGSTSGSAVKLGPLDSLEITWPDGRVETFSPPPSGHYTTLVRGSGHSVRASTESSTAEGQN